MIHPTALLISPDLFILLDYHGEALSKGLHIRYLPHFYFSLSKNTIHWVGQEFFSVNCYWLLPVTITSLKNSYIIHLFVLRHNTIALRVIISHFLFPSPRFLFKWGSPNTPFGQFFGQSFHSPYLLKYSIGSSQTLFPNSLNLRGIKFVPGWEQGAAF